jgi:hypothetical protein
MPTPRKPTAPTTPAHDAGNAGEPLPKGRPDDGRARTEEVLERGLPPDERREPANQPPAPRR